MRLQAWWRAGGWRAAVNEALREPLARAAPAMAAAARLHRMTRSRDADVVAVVGSLGKTTTTRAIHTALGRRVSPSAARPNTGTAFFAGFLREAKRRPIVVEMGIRGPNQMHLSAWGVRPTMVVVTSIGREHIKSFRGGVPHIRHEKAHAVRALPRDGLAILNADDPNVRWMATQTCADVLFYGRGPRADVRAERVVLRWPEGMDVSVVARGERHVLRTQLYGEHFVASLLAAFAVATELGRPAADVARDLERLRPTQGRLERVVLPSGAVIIRDDYKATEDTVLPALRVLAEAPARRRIVVLGGLDSVPNPQRPKYREAGAAVGGSADLVVLIGEQFPLYWPGMRDAGLRRQQILRVADVAEATQLLRGELGPGDVVLLKGRVGQKLGRVALGLQREAVACAITHCPFGGRQYCDHCAFLRRREGPGNLG